MADFGTVISIMREQMQMTLSRSDVLRALVWPMSICVVSALGNTISHGPEWFSMIFVATFLACLAVYLFSYLFCLKNDRDALRSERYNAHKLSLEHGALGDSSLGMIDPPQPRSIAAPTKAEEKK